MDRQVTVVYVTDYKGSLYAHAFNSNGIEITYHSKQYLVPDSLRFIERVMRNEANRQPINWVTDDPVIGQIAREIGLDVTHDATASRLMEK
nr:MAG TPA: Nif11 domain [Caudoviricetes sp.]